MVMVNLRLGGLNPVIYRVPAGEHARDGLCWAVVPEELRRDRFRAGLSPIHDICQGSADHIGPHGNGAFAGRVTWPNERVKPW